jgi:hypothetical protein
MGTTKTDEDLAAENARLRVELAEARAQLARYQRCTQARRLRTELRCATLHAIIEHRHLPTAGRGAWYRIRQALWDADPELAVRPGRRPAVETLLYLTSKDREPHLVSPRRLSRMYRAWLAARSGADCNPTAEKTGDSRQSSRSGQRQGSATG